MLGGPTTFQDGIARINHSMGLFRAAFNEFHGSADPISYFSCRTSVVANTHPAALTRRLRLKVTEFSLLEQIPNPTGRTARQSIHRPLVGQVQVIQDLLIDNLALAFLPGVKIGDRLGVSGRGRPVSLRLVGIVR